ncbi:LAFA_0B05974g1_1 [Lachancea sp. 'fantastica']|nr:LAFA_0B05974g1_1 [Lachancea sp. 'fantastica']
MPMYGLKPSPFFRGFKTNILGIGTDIVHIPRFARLMARDASIRESRINERILGKFMHAAELSRLQRMREENHSDKALIQFVAGVWATKEAVYKSLSSRSGHKKTALPPAKYIYTQLCYKTNDEGGIPRLVIDPKLTSVYPNFTRDFIENTKFLLSISHDNDYLVSFVCHVSV